MRLWRRLRYLLPAVRRAEEREMHEELESLAAMAGPAELGNLTLAYTPTRMAAGFHYVGWQRSPSNLEATFHNKADVVPKGTYSFMDKDGLAIRMWVSLIAGSHVPDEVVYKYVKAIAENQARVQSIGGSLKSSPFTTAKMATNPANLPYHPGALRYYREKGLVK